MIDRFIYKFFSSIDLLFDTIIPRLYERLKKNRIFSRGKKVKR
jgi:hypothetical protein